MIGHRTQGKSHVLKVLKGASSDETRSFLKELLRDAGIRRHLDGLTRRHGGGDFYAHRAHGLRMTRARLKNAGVQVRPEGDTAELHRPSALMSSAFLCAAPHAESWAARIRLSGCQPLPVGGPCDEPCRTMPYVTHARERERGGFGNMQVDHTLECQLLAHVMTQTEELRPILAQLNSSEKSDKLQLQSHAVQNCLRPIYELHNGGEEHDYFNLRLVAQGPNLIKGHVVSTFIKQCDARERCGSVAANPPRFDLRGKLVEQFTIKGEGKFEAGASLDER